MHSPGRDTRTSLAAVSKITRQSESGVNSQKSAQYSIPYIQRRPRAAELIFEK